MDEKEEGGLTKLRRFVAERGIPWPQYYLGGAETPFTRERGVTGIPQLFLIDRDGTLYSTSARCEIGAVLPKFFKEAGK